MAAAWPVQHEACSGRLSSPSPAVAPSGMDEYDDKQTKMTPSDTCKLYH
eukprot:COSAG05_NODE_2106_length_3551_cov_18.915411_3_plen_49_part_00